MNVSFEVLSPVGALVRTFDSEALAKRFVLRMKTDLPGLRIDRVTVTTTRQAVYRPRARRVA